MKVLAAKNENTSTDQVSLRLKYITQKVTELVLVPEY